MNAKRQGDLYEVQDAFPHDEEITFSWLVGRYAVAYKGDVHFNVCLKWIGADGVTIDREFNTTIATLPVLEGLEVSAQVIQEASDIIEQLRRNERELMVQFEAEIDAQVERLTGDVDGAVEDANARIAGSVRHDQVQTLSEEQKARARSNIGASNFSGKYADLEDKPTIPSLSNDIDSVDTTMAATSKAVKDVADIANAAKNAASDISTAVLYGKTQELTEEQKVIARSNIGASNFSGKYADLTEKPGITSGTFTIATGNSTYVKNISTQEAKWVRSGNVVMCSMYFTATIVHKMDDIYPIKVTGVPTPYAGLSYLAAGGRFYGSDGYPDAMNVFATVSGTTWNVDMCASLASKTGDGVKFYITLTYIAGDE